MKTKPKPDILALAQPYKPELPVPDMGMLTGYANSTPSFPLQVFGDRLSAWIKDAAETKGCPPDYVACSLLGVAASLIGNTRRVSPWSGWVESACLWVALVGRPSSGKSPGMQALLDSLDKLQETLLPEFEVKWAKYQTDLETSKIAKGIWEKEYKDAKRRKEPEPDRPKDSFEPEKPGQTRLFVADVTVEAVIRAHYKNTRGIMVIRDELAEWIESMERSKKGSDAHFWLQCTSGGSYSVNRVYMDHKPIVIPKIQIGVMGGIQPARIQESLFSRTDDGMSARFLYCWPEPIQSKRPT